jgi:hypothetical protein
MNFVSVKFLLLFFWIKLLVKMANIPTIQKRYRPFTSIGFASMLKPNVFDGSNYKRWRQRCILWMTSMHCFFVVEPRAVGPHTPKEDNAFHDADVRFRARLLSMLGDTIVDAYVPLQSGKEMRDALEQHYGVSDVGSELYVMEQFHDYRMVDDHSVVEQAHEIQALVKDLEMHGCDLPDKFVAGCMIAKLPPSWTEFATSLKHKRREFDVTQLIGTLDVEDKARAKDVKGKKVAEGGSSAHVVQKNRPKPHKKKNQ